jgi:hypothetical protein
MRRILVRDHCGHVATGLGATLPAQGVEARLVGRPRFEFDQPDAVAAARPEALVNCVVMAEPSLEGVAFRRGGGARQGVEMVTVGSPSTTGAKGRGRRAMAWIRRRSGPE